MTDSLARRSSWALLIAVAFLALATGCGPDQTHATISSEAVRLNNRGVALMGRFDFDGAAREFSAALEQAPSHAEILVNQAVAVLNRQAEGDEAAALGILDGVRAENPGHLRAIYCSGVLHLHAGRPEEALALFAEVVAADPDDADATYFEGQCLMQMGRHDDALQRYQRAVDLDPSLRSAYYRGFQALQRLGEMEQAQQWLATFQGLDSDPRARVVEFKYTRMGAMAEVKTVGDGAVEVEEQPAGPLFGQAETVALAGGGEADAQAVLSACDVDGDGHVDLFAAGPAGTRMMLADGNGALAVDQNHPLNGITDVNAALWGDVDNDGLTDVYLCRGGANQLWRQSPAGRWQEISETAGTSGGAANTVDGLIIDADHDGDLDLLLVNADGPDVLLNNNRDGSFRALDGSYGVAGDGRGSRAVIATDLDADRDLDLVILHRSPPHRVLENQLGWRYEEAAGWQAFRFAEIQVAVAGDVDCNGEVEIYTVTADSGLGRWSRSNGEMVLEPLSSSETLVAPTWLALADITGDGALELVGGGPVGWWVAALHGTELQPIFRSDQGFTTASFLLQDVARGPALVGWLTGSEPRLWPAGSGRHGFSAVELSGRQDSSGAVRSNASGIGARVAARVASRWTVLGTVRCHSGPGQGLQPLSVGLGSAALVDFVAVDWSDGVYQTEMDLAAGELHRVSETERQLSSCPVLFAWDGEKYRFVSDLLGVGGMGYAVGPPGEYAPPRPRESLMLPAGLPVARDGRVELKLSEPMEEATYLDSVQLMFYDLPPGWFMTLDERMAVSGSEPSGQPRFYRRQLLPVEVVNDRGSNVTDSVLEADLRAAPVGELDHRFLGRLANDHVLVLKFAEALNGHRGRVLLVADGWVEYSYSQTNFAAWQAGADYRPPTLDARGADGRWLVQRAGFGYPAGMPRQMSIPLRRINRETRELRLSTNMEVYWDRLAVAFEESPGTAVRSQRLPLLAASLVSSGFAVRSTGEQRAPSYDYERRVPLWDTRHQTGYYTRFGSVADLVVAADDAVAIFGPGEEVHLDFAAPREEPPEGFTRVYVIEAEGWCKDMDLYTGDGATLEPLPSTPGRIARHRTTLHRIFNTRYQSGRN